MEASLVQGVLDLDENSLQKYETACNHILFLFFPSSLKRIANLPSLQLSLITRLTNCISNRLDRVIINYSSAA